MSHHYALLISYGVALLGWLAAARALPKLWPRCDAPTFPHPWVEIGLAMVAGVIVLVLGQLYLREWLLPRAPGLLGGVSDACNQIIIFSPLLLLLALRRHPLRTAWLPLDRVWLRILVGTLLALISILVFTMARPESDHWLAVVGRVYHPQNLSHLVQVFLEDVAIAILFVRFRAAIGLRRTIALVAILFALGHIPSLLADGAGIAELASLLLDAGLAVVVLSVVQRSADIWWFWSIHFALDMMQFHAVPDPPTLAAA
ncbi:MAG: hypothetical protein ACYTEY_02565 [Planctomycetota bacterium]